MADQLYERREFADEHGLSQYAPVNNPDPRGVYFVKRVDANDKIYYLQQSDPHYDGNVHKHDPAVARKALEDLRAAHLAVTIVGMFLPLVNVVGFPIIFMKIKRIMSKYNLKQDPKEDANFTTYAGIGWVAWVLTLVIILYPIGFFLWIALATLGGEWLAKNKHKVTLVNKRLYDSHLVVTILGIFIPIVFTIGFPIVYGLLIGRLVRRRLLRDPEHKRKFITYSVLGIIAWLATAFASITIIASMAVPFAAEGTFPDGARSAMGALWALGAAFLVALAVLGAYWFHRYAVDEELAAEGEQELAPQAAKAQHA
jgi:Trk-type K+ transport system membrane component